MTVELGQQIQKTDKVQRIGGVGLLPKPVTSAVSPDGSTATVQVLGGAGIGTGPDVRPETPFSGMDAPYATLSTEGAPLRPSVTKTAPNATGIDGNIPGYVNQGSEAK